MPQFESLTSISRIVVFLVAFLSFAHGKSHCIGTCYSGSLFPETQDIFHGKHLKGFSYNNITTDDPAKCYRHCVQDCRCKACQMKDARCELLDKDKTSKADDFKDEPGYVYFDLRQTMYQGISHTKGECYNGCCRSQPCLNGGICVEHCKSPKQKFSCKCPDPFSGTVCKKATRSCLDILKASPSGTTPKNDVYKILSQKSPTTIDQVYCNFKTPDQVWTLIESFSRDSNGHFKVKAFHQHNKRSEESPNWIDYRISQRLLHFLHGKSTMFRATCNFPNRNGILKPDYLFGYLSDYDIVTHGDLSDDGECKKYFYINIRGHEFHNVTMPTWHRKDKHHLHTGYPLKSPPMCGFQPLQDVVKGEACFGFYDHYHPQFKCTETGSSTTQWWLGAKI